jgi:hypothetical protein
MTREDALLAAVAVAIGVIAGVLIARRRRAHPVPGSARILFPIAGPALSRPTLEAALRLARADDATLVPAYLAAVPLHLPLDAALARECEVALPLLEAVEQRAAATGVAVDSRIERGRTYRHALLGLLEREPFERIVVAAAPEGAPGFTAEDVAWLLRRAPGDIVVLRPAEEAPLAERNGHHAAGVSSGGREDGRERAGGRRARAA